MKTTKARGTFRRKRLLGRMLRGFYFTAFGGILLFSGCRSLDTVEMPNILHPGHIDVQRARMERFNPYAEDGFAPKIEGDRPAGMGVPREPVREFEGRDRTATGFP